jgi:DNA-directed RNA polymerase specialized sigma24 family protein
MFKKFAKLALVLVIPLAVAGGFSPVRADLDKKPKPPPYLSEIISNAANADLTQPVGGRLSKGRKIQCNDMAEKAFRSGDIAAIKRAHPETYDQAILEMLAKCARLGPEAIQPNAIGFISRAARLRSYDEFRKKRNHDSFDAETFDEAQTINPLSTYKYYLSENPEFRLEATQLAKGFVGLLSNDEITVASLLALGFTQEEIARDLGITVSAVQKRLARATPKIKKLTPTESTNRLIETLNKLKKSSLTSNEQDEKTKILFMKSPNTSTFGSYDPLPPPPPIPHEGFGILGLAFIIAAIIAGIAVVLRILSAIFGNQETSRSSHSQGSSSHEQRVRAVAAQQQTVRALAIR